MRRRDFIVAISGAAALPMAALAQRAEIDAIGSIANARELLAGSGYGVRRIIPRIVQEAGHRAPGHCK